MSAIEEREAAVADLREYMQEEFGYQDTLDEIDALNNEVKRFMSANDVKHVFRDGYKLTLVRRGSSAWDQVKLKNLLPKSVWLKVTRQVLDPEKLDDLVRTGGVKMKEIKSAYITVPQAPHVRRYDYTEGQTKEDVIAEEAKLREALSSGGDTETTPAQGVKRKYAT